MPATYSSALEGLTTSVAVKAPCRVATTAAINLASAPASIDGVTLSAGPPFDRILVRAQSSSIDNGLYDFHGAGYPLTRSKDANGTLDLVGGTHCSVVEGDTYNETFWLIDGYGPIIVGADPITFTLRSDMQGPQGPPGQDGRARVATCANP